MKQFDYFTQKRILWLLAKLIANTENDRQAFILDQGTAEMCTWKLSYLEQHQEDYLQLQVSKESLPMATRTAFTIAIHKQTFETILERYTDMLVGFQDLIEWVYESPMKWQLYDEDQYDRFIDVVQNVISQIWHQQKLPALKHEIIA